MKLLYSVKTVNTVEHYWKWKQQRLMKVAVVRVKNLLLWAPINWERNRQRLLPVKCVIKREAESCCALLKLLNAIKTTEAQACCKCDEWRWRTLQADTASCPLLFPPPPPLSPSVSPSPLSLFLPLLLDFPLPSTSPNTHTCLAIVHSCKLIIPKYSSLHCVALNSEANLTFYYRVTSIISLYFAIWVGLPYW